MPLRTTAQVRRVVDLGDPTAVAMWLGGFAVASFIIAAAAALVYRWYTREPIPVELAALFGLAAVALYLNTVGLFSQLLGGGTTDLFDLDRALFNVAAFALALVAAPVGRIAGDRIATDVFAVVGVRELEADVSRLLRTVGKVTSVTLPETEDIEDIEGYDPVDPERKADIGGKTFLLPRRLTPADRRDRLATRLKDDHGIGHVDVEFGDGGEVTYLAVGGRVAGLGPTLGPGTAAVPVRADPANGASPGDVVQVWRTDPTERVLTGELRAADDDVVTVVVDESEAGRLDAGTSYRLLTLPAEPRVDREFVTLLRSADETMGVVTLAPDSPLVGERIGDLDVAVVAVRPEGRGVDTVPSRTRTLEVGDTAFVLALPEALRQLERRAGAGSAEAQPS